jgi:hypothetical protein
VPGATQSSLSDVSCTSATACIAVGNYTNSAGTVLTLAEDWNGTKWQVQTTLNPTGAQSSVLDGVSCTSASTCTAVGYYTSGGQVLTLAERWDGTAWTIQQTGNPGIGSHYLYSVSCTTSTACTAVGAYSYRLCNPFRCWNVHGPLGEGWDGASWTVQSGLPVYQLGISFVGVSCYAAAACEAVGSLGASTLAGSWNGTTWGTQSPQNAPGAAANQLNGVSCSAATSCTAVGWANGTLAEVLIGTTWAIQPTPNPTGATSSQFFGVSCTPHGVCSAVGYYYPNGASEPLPLVERYS